jgi:hypothetical protein
MLLRSKTNALNIKTWVVGFMGSGRKEEEPDGNNSSLSARKVPANS